MFKEFCILFLIVVHEKEENCFVYIIGSMVLKNWRTEVYYEKVWEKNYKEQKCLN
jgi:hypothetical protein